LTGGTFENAATSATLTLAPSGTSIQATFQSEGQPSAMLNLRETSNLSASLAASNQGFPGEWGYCGGGAVELDGGRYVVADPAPAPATLNLSSAQIAVDEGVAFLQLVGPVIDVQGQNGCAPDQSPSSPLSALLVCDTSSTSGNSGPTGGTVANSAFAPGAYDCTSLVTGTVTYDGKEDGVTDEGMAGVLTLTANGSSLTAAYSDDSAGSGSLQFTLTSDRSANLVPGQTFDVTCLGLDPTTLMSSTDPTVTQASAGALMTDGTTVYLTFLGNVPSGTCAGQTSTMVLQCTPKGA
jgi:hypothetical protein